MTTTVECACKRCGDSGWEAGRFPCSCDAGTARITPAFLSAARTPMQRASAKRFRRRAKAAGKAAAGKAAAEKAAAEKAAAGKAAAEKAAADTE